MFTEAAKNFYVHSDDDSSCGDNEDGENIDDWSVGTGDTEQDEVDDDTFEMYCPIIPKATGAGDTEKDDTFKATGGDATNSAGNSPSAKNAAAPPGSDEASSVVDVTKPKWERPPKNPVVKCTIKQAFGSGLHVVQARKTTSRKTSEYRFVRTCLYCDECTDHGCVDIHIGDNNYRHACLGNKWFDSDYILGFCALLAHDAHLEVPPFADGQHRVKMIHCPYPTAVVKEENVLSYSNVVNHFVMVAFSRAHYAVLDFDLHSRAVGVFDGLNYKITNWENHIIRTLREYGLVPLLAVAKSNYSSELNGNDKTQMLQISFGEEAPWIVTNLHHHRQKDGHNCGPIACLKVMEIYGYLDTGAIDIIAHNRGGYRNVVVETFDRLVSKYEETLVIEHRLKFDEFGNVVGSRDNHPADAIGSGDNPPTTAAAINKANDGMKSIDGIPSEIAIGPSGTIDKDVDVLTTNMSTKDQTNNDGSKSVDGATDDGSKSVDGVVVPTTDMLIANQTMDDGMKSVDGVTVDSDDVPTEYPECKFQTDQFAAQVDAFSKAALVTASENGTATASNTEDGCRLETDQFAAQVDAFTKAALAIDDVPASHSRKSKRAKHLTERAKDYYADIIDSSSSHADLGTEENIEQLTRLNAMEKKRKMQEVNARKAIKQRGEVLIADGLGTGAVLGLKVDYRTHSHASGLVAIVYKANDTGAALVCCEHGVITHDGTKGDYWVPSDKFVILAGYDDIAVLTPELQKLRDDVINGVYDYKLQPRISYSKYHERVIGASSPCKRSVCSCKNGCSNRCGCRQKKIECNSTCGCSGNCNNSGKSNDRK